MIGYINEKSRYFLSDRIIARDVWRAMFMQLFSSGQLENLKTWSNTETQVNYAGWKRQKYCGT